MTARIVPFPTRVPSALCQWQVSEDGLCPRRAFYAVLTSNPDAPPATVCSQHLDVALQMSVAAPGELQISPLVINRMVWPVAQLAWHRARLQRIRELLESAGLACPPVPGIEDEVSA